jgi:mannose-1-phosphate guanylyltransferase/mannose-6-phosphate isomerase
MFVLRVSTWLKALEYLRPDIAAAAQTAWQGKTIDTPFIRPVKTTFTQVPSESVDYAVMEKRSGSNYPIHMGLVDDWNDLEVWPPFGNSTKTVIKMFKAMWCRVCRVG